METNSNYRLQPREHQRCGGSGEPPLSAHHDEELRRRKWMLVCPVCKESFRQQRGNVLRIH